MKTFKLKDERISLNPKEYRKFEHKFIEVRVFKDSKYVSFIKYVTQSRFYIPKELREHLNLNRGDTIDIELNEIKNKRRDKQIIKNSKFNILSLIPEKTRSGYPILVLDKWNEWKCLYITYGGSREITIKKEVPLEFSKLLGYYQSEGRKNRVEKGEGREFTFTNTSYKIIKDFVELLSYLIDVRTVKICVYPNKKLTKKDFEILRKSLINLGLDEGKIKIYKPIQVKKYSIMLRMENTLFSDIIDNILERTKNYIINEESKYVKKLRIYFMKGLFNGDGTFFSIRDKYGSNHSGIKFFERDLLYIRDYEKMLEQLGFIGRIRKEKNKNLYVLTVYLNWTSLLRIFELELLKDKNNHYEKLLETIKNHRWNKSHKYFTKLDLNFNGENIRSLMPKEICYSWVRKRINEEMVKREGIGNYQMTQQGIYVKRILEKLETEREHL